MSWRIENTDVLSGLRSLADGSVHCCVTSPPYWGLRDYGVDGQLGLERTPDEYVAKMVEVFREVRRVLRDDGTLWLNIGDGYNAYNGNRGASESLSKPYNDVIPVADRGLTCASLKPKDLIGMPWALAFALRADGWWLRSEIIWAKKSPMPESVRDRPTKAHEQIFLLTKSARYFYDAVASAESAQYGYRDGGMRSANYLNNNAFDNDADLGDKQTVSGEYGGVRNMRSVWHLGPEPFPEAHFATFPTELVRKCLLAGTSTKGCCPECGAFWRRVTKTSYEKTQETNNTSKHHQVHGRDEAQFPRSRRLDETTGWQPGCQCGAEPVGCLVLDPFAGAGTTIMLARRMQCRSIGFELNPKYVAMATKRIEQDAPLWNVSA